MEKNRSYLIDNYPTIEKSTEISGRVVGVGTHETLIDECPAYAELVDSQCVDTGVGGRR